MGTPWSATYPCIDVQPRAVNRLFQKSNVQRSALPDSYRCVSKSSKASNPPRISRLQLHCLESDPGSSSSRVHAFHAGRVEPLQIGSRASDEESLQRAAAIVSGEVHECFFNSQLDHSLRNVDDGSQGPHEAAGVRPHSEFGQGGSSEFRFPTSTGRLVPLGNSGRAGRFSLEERNPGAGGQNSPGAHERSGSVAACSGECLQGFGSPSSSLDARSCGELHSNQGEPLDQQALRGLQELDHLLRERVEAFFQDGDGDQNKFGTQHTLRSIPFRGSRNGECDSPDSQAWRACGAPEQGRAAFQAPVSVSPPRHCSLGTFDPLQVLETRPHSRKSQTIRGSRQTSRPPSIMLGTTAQPSNISNNGKSDAGLLLQNDSEGLRWGRPGGPPRSSPPQPAQDSGSFERYVNPPFGGNASEKWDGSGSGRDSHSKIHRRTQSSPLSRDARGTPCFKDVAFAAGHKTLTQVQNSDQPHEGGGGTLGGCGRACEAKWLRLSSLPKQLQKALGKISNLENFNEVWEALRCYVVKKNGVESDVCFDAAFEKLVEYIHSKCIDTSCLMSSISESLK